MKTKHIILSVLISICCVSCTTPYQVSTIIGEDGTVQRKMYANDLSILLPGHQWEITQEDTLRVHYGGEVFSLTNKASRNFTSLKEATSAMLVDPLFEPLLKPTESFDKHFRWFYTYYHYKAVFPELKKKPTVPLSAYLTPEESRLWLEGSYSSWDNKSGAEIYQQLQAIEEKFILWANRNLLDICLDIIRDYIPAEELPDKEEFFKWIFKKYGREQTIMDEGDYFDVQLVCNLLDQYLNTNKFSQLYTENKKEFQHTEETNYEPLLELFSMVLIFEMELPGEIIYVTNPEFNNRKKVSWKITPYRFLADDFLGYEIMATSRTPNKWAFGVTLLIILVAVGSIVYLVRKSRQ